MKDRTLIKDLKKNIDKEVAVSGYVDVRRDHGKLVFLDIRDRTGIVQSVVLPNNEEALKKAQTLRHEYVVELVAVVNKRPEKMINKDVDNGDIELEVKEVFILSKADELPFEKDADVNLDTSLDYRPFTLRNFRNRAIFKVQHHISKTFRSVLDSEDFVEFQPPKIVGGDAEGGAGVFKLEYFKGQDAFLATSPQLYKQIMVGVHERVYNIGNVFRAEKHSTSRHLNEYTSMDAEMGFISDHHDVMNMLNKVMVGIVENLKKECETEFKILDAKLPLTPDVFPNMKLREAQELIFKETGEDCRDEKDLAPEHERWLCEYAKKEFNSDFIFITHYPVTKTAFYAYEDEKDAGYAKYFDLLFRGVEIVSGGQRIHDYETLKKRISDKGLNPENFNFYLQAFKYGIPPHGGWGMGLERLTQKMLNLKNVKEATLFPREINRIDTLLSE